MTDAPTVDTNITIQLQIVLFQQNSFDELACVSTYIADILYAAQNLHNPPVTVSTLQAMIPQQYIGTNNCKTF